MTILNAQEHRRSRIPGILSSLASGFNPLSLPNLQAWYQTNLEVGYSNGSAVSTIKDWSGQGRNLSGSGTYVVSGGVSLIDSDDFATTNRSASGSAAFTFSIFGDSYNNDGTLFGIGTSTTTRGSCNVCRSKIYSWAGDTAFPDAGSGCLLTVVYPGGAANLKIYRNDEYFCDVNVGGAYNVQAGIYMFRWWNNDRQSTLRMRLGVVYNRALTLEEIVQLDTYRRSFVD